MRPAHRTRATHETALRAQRLALAATLGLVLLGPATAEAQQDEATPAAAGQTEAAAQTGRAPSADDPLTFLDSVTVSATLRPAPVRETPGMVSVIDSRTIEERLVRDFADLVKYEPGVYIENNVTRLGLNGFNIRGIGGNRVMTQVDGVQTSEQFDFGPFNVHQVGLDVDALKTVEIVRSANSALYGSDALGGVVSLFTKDPADYLRGRGVHLGAKTTWDGRSDAINGNLASVGTLGQRAVRSPGGDLPARQRGAVRAGCLPGRRSGRLRLACGIADVPPRPVEPDRQQALRMVERAGSSGERPDHRSVHEPREQRRPIARVRLVAQAPTTGVGRPMRSALRPPQKGVLRACATH